MKRFISKKQQRRKGENKMPETLEKQIQDTRRKLEKLEQKAKKQAGLDMKKAIELYRDLDWKAQSFLRSVLTGKPSDYPGLKEILEKVTIKEVGDSPQDVYAFRSHTAKYPSFYFYYKLFNPGWVDPDYHTKASVRLGRTTKYSALWTDDARFKELEEVLIGDDLVIKTRSSYHDHFLPVFFLFYDKIGGMSYEEALEKTRDFFENRDSELNDVMRMYKILQKHTKT